ncbi:MAG: hypothetical protein OXI24_19410, partial [Candidatus Poribacteria bacterium]|nr:hypothetical protein [Candidatus Poribacteria bacterium]
MNTFPAADEGTWGVVTNGTQWIVLRRIGGRVPITAIGEPVEARSLDQVSELLSPLRERTKTSSKVQEEPPTDWFSVAADCDSPYHFMQRIAPNEEKQEGWDGASFAKVGEYTPLNGQLFPESIYLTCLSLDYPDGRLSPQDIAEALLMLHNGEGRVAGIAYTTSRPERVRYVRAFLREDGKLYATPLVDARLPGSRATRQVRLLAKDFAETNVTDVIAILSAESLQRRFHEEISTWFLRTTRSRNELRHLIRILFVWLLQERGVVPDDTLWRADINWRDLPVGYIHEHVLWLFDNVLSKPIDFRSSLSSTWHDDLMRTVPFLNGSLFTELRAEDQPEPLTNEQYVDLDQGLFSILGRYDWTLSERTGYATESAIDASMLGDLFERLILVTDGPRVEPNEHIKMPGGTYYTPQDIADEMVADALSGWTERMVGDRVSLHDLFHPAPQSREWENLTHSQLRATWHALKDATILDPCCGSGVFTVAALQGLWRARKRLFVTIGTGDNITDNTDSLDYIIEHNLFATDIHPLAVLITRLRIFIALVDIRGRELKPLPNLDTRIVAANTLCVNIRGQLSIEDPGIHELMGDLGAVREAWTTTYTPKDKEAVLQLDRELRAKIHEKSDLGADNELEWLEVD